MSVVNFRCRAEPELRMVFAALEVMTANCRIPVTYPAYNMEIQNVYR